MSQCKLPSLILVSCNRKQIQKERKITGNQKSLANMERKIENPEFLLIKKQKGTNTIIYVYQVISKLKLMRAFSNMYINSSTSGVRCQVSGVIPERCMV